MSKSYNVIFYSKLHNLILAKQIKDIISRKGYGVINIDDIANVFINKDLMVKYLVLDFTNEILDSSVIDLLEKMNLEGAIDKIIVVYNKTIQQRKSFYYIKCDDNFLRNFNNMFDAFIKETEKNISITMGSWRRNICEKLLEWDFPLKQNGTMLIIEGIIYYISRNTMIKNLDKEFYDYASRKYKMSKYSVELNIRTSITIASKSSNFPCNQHMTNKSFLTFAVSYFYDLLTSMTIAV